MDRAVDLSSDFALALKQPDESADPLSSIVPVSPGCACLHDVQSESDTRGIMIEQVGITGLRYPIRVLDRAAEAQSTVGTVTLSVGLPHHLKGTHMSRFMTVLERHRGEISVRTLPALLTDVKATLNAESARVELRFPYFLERTAPVSGAEALVDYQCSFLGEINGGELDFVLGAEVPVSSVCPCSRVISEQGAHNQRGRLQVQIRSSELVWITELVEIAQASGSSPVYALVTRRDLRHLTMQGYDNPKFVEDMVRDVAVRLQRDWRVTWFRVRAENVESIHNHNAFAELTWARLTD